MSAERVPEYAENPGYGIYPCDSDWHTEPRPYGAEHNLGDRCPTCGNKWWASDGSECPEEYALICEIDRLRNEL